MEEVRFTDRELDVMAVLWERGPSTVAEVKERIEDELAYTTVLTILRTLEAKGHVGHEEEGKAHRYSSLVARERAGESALRHMVAKLFRGSPSMLLTQLVADESLSAGEIKRMRKLLKRRLEQAEEDE
jgi:BlaI family penicillinase repressor